MRERQKEAKGVTAHGQNKELDYSSPVVVYVLGSVSNHVTTVTM